MNAKHFTHILPLFLILATALQGCSSKQNKKSGNSETAQKVDVAIDKNLQHRLDSFAHAPRPKGLFGVYVYDLTADKPVYGNNERESQPSASCMKLLCGVAGLKLLGTNYTLDTKLYTTGKVANDTLYGDVIFQGGLDPQLKPEDLKAFAGILKHKGIKSVKGRYILDVLLHEPVKAEEHWYTWDLTISQFGLFYRGEDYLKRQFLQAMNAAGFRVAQNQIVMGKKPKGAHCVFLFRRHINKLIQRMWKNSANTQSTALLYAIGHKLSPQGNYAQVGVNYLRQFLHERIGLCDTSLVIHDGCGLCTHNHLSPLALCSIIRYAYHQPALWSYFRRFLAVSGVDGTLRGELNDPRLKGLIHGKTGTLSHPWGISTLAGYCKSSNGHTLCFAIMDCQMSVLDARVLQRNLCRELVK
ncbi:MAG: D-alanyl-D-alanine carboxypeptidase [Prevotella sp.]|nr:D-alanyl-D-alanine carboxypeptidase [Prevotella sp.]